MALANIAAEEKQNLTSEADVQRKVTRAESAILCRFWIYADQGEKLEAHQLDLDRRHHEDTQIQRPRPEGFPLLSASAFLAFCVGHQRNSPVIHKLGALTVRMGIQVALTSLPVEMHLLQGRLVSQAKCFFLQFTHADGT